MPAALLKILTDVHFALAFAKVVLVQKHSIFFFVSCSVKQCARCHTEAVLTRGKLCSAAKTV